jgi:hypothetical protein
MDSMICRSDTVQELLLLRPCAALSHLEDLAEGPVTLQPTKEPKSRLCLAQMQVTKDHECVTRAVGLSVLAKLLLLRLYGRDLALGNEWSLFKLKERFTEGAAQEHMTPYCAAMVACVQPIHTSSVTCSRCPVTLDERL